MDCSPRRTEATTWTVRNPVYLGRRWRSKWGDLLLVERRTMGRATPFRPNDCPECMDRFEVGDAEDPRAVELAMQLLRHEAPHMIHDAWRLCDEVLAWIPKDREWSMDGCSIRDWADNVGRVRVRYVENGKRRASEVKLPHSDYRPRRTTAPAAQVEASVASRPPSEGQRREMGAVLEQIEGNAF